ncbi:putative F-box protein At3g49980 [Lolium rigidum]|uniref:putative F-box protein At3g49980 n=1 Tax=Lolium rigidum TaxID=89674 RepID=UPI001F5C4E09|nr:putative F-box protein At3g49980 [Lolium rigidum]
MSSHRRHARSPAVTPLDQAHALDDEDLLGEILLRLPPDPSSLPRASAVCKRWRSLISDPGFFRRFRLRHRRNPPLLGFFDRYAGLSFLPTLEAPNRVPPGRFSLEHDDDFERSMSLGCRHGLFLIFLSKPRQVLVWDPITGDKHHIAVPAAFATEKTHGLVNGAVRRPAGEGKHFQVVLAVADDKQQALACVYSSETGLWGNIISTPVPDDDDDGIPPMVYTDDAVMAGDSLYWQLAGTSAILEFDLVKQSLAVIEVPMDTSGEDKSLKIMRAEGGGLGLLLVSDSNSTAQLWKRETDGDGVASWGLAKTIELDKLLSLKPEEQGMLVVLGFAEENNVVFLWTVIGVHMINLDSLKFKKLFKTNHFTHYHPFESVYTAATSAGGGHDGAELLLNA